jgi:hypothetical protein
MHLIAAHPALVRALAVVAFATLVLALLRLTAWLVGRPRHRSWRRALDTGHTPRHAAQQYLGRHEADAAGTAVVLGAHPDGDITLIHADPPAVRLADAPTVETRALIGAAA